jgi:acetyl esterase/lipase
MTIRTRRALVAALTLVLVAGLPPLVNRTSVQPAAALVRLGFGLGTLVKPPAGYAAIRARVDVRRDVEVPVAGAPAAILDVYTPRSATTPRPVVLWVHGGGFLSGSRAQVGDYATVLAERGFVVAALEYSLAPRHHYPVPVEQGTAALSYLAANAIRFGGNARALFVGGDSAGAQIAAELAAVQTNTTLAATIGLPSGVRVAGVLLFCGLFDMDTVGATGFPAVRTYLWSYTGHRDWTRYPRIDELSTTRQATRGYPPTYLTVGDLDPFEPQARELESVLRQLGVDVTTRYWTDTHLRHEYQFDLRTAAARTVLSDTVTFLNGYAK